MVYLLIFFVFALYSLLSIDTVMCSICALILYFRWCCWWLFSTHSNDIVEAFVVVGITAMHIYNLNICKFSIPKPKPWSWYNVSSRGTWLREQRETRVGYDLGCFDLELFLRLFPLFLGLKGDFWECLNRIFQNVSSVNASNRYFQMVVSTG
jgi:hypothetical protein